MRAEGHVSESVWGHLRRFSIQKDCRSAGLGLDRKGGNLHCRSEQQMDFRTHSLSNLNVLPEGFIVLQSGGNLMRSEGYMSESVWRHLRRLSIQEDCGPDGLGLD